MKLSPVTRKFVLHWGEMGTRWGINRTVAQIHALLYISEKPLTAEEIAATLQTPVPFSSKCSSSSCFLYCLPALIGRCHERRRKSVPNGNQGIPALFFRSARW